jgi:hypothetical protein
MTKVKKQLEKVKEDKTQKGEYKSRLRGKSGKNTPASLK